MIIKSISQTSYQGMYKVQPEEGSSFFVRPEYVSDIVLETIGVGMEFTGELEGELLDAGLCSAAELKAVGYLARAEQSRFGLTRKLLQKGFAGVYIEKSLDFLEKADYLSDARFARAWLNSRRTNHLEGRTRLLAELSARGISRDVANSALDEFFAENDEQELCNRAYEKLSAKKSGDKLVAALLHAGFTYRQVRAAEEYCSVL